MKEEMKLDRAEFISWLKSKPEDEVVGYRGDGNSCPISNFLISREGVIAVSIEHKFPYYITKDKQSVELKLPAWAHLFIDKFDDSVYGDLRDLCAGRSKECLEILENIGE